MWHIKLVPAHKRLIVSIIISKHHVQCLQHQYAHCHHAYCGDYSLYGFHCLAGNLLIDALQIVGINVSELVGRHTNHGKLSHQV